MLPYIKKGNQDEITTTKSKIFQESLKYEFLFKTNPKAIIFKIISIPKSIANVNSIDEVSCPGELSSGLALANIILFQIITIKVTNSNIGFFIILVQIY